MKKVLLLFFVGLLALSANAQKSRKKIEASFKTFQTAMIQSNGEVVASMLDSLTLEHFERVRMAVLNEDSISLINEASSFCLTVLLSRLEMQQHPMTAQDGKSFVVWALEAGVMGAQGVKDIKLANIVVDGVYATSEIVNATKNVIEEPASTTMSFRKEGKFWKVDLIPLFESTERFFSEALKKGSDSKFELIQNLLKVYSSQKGLSLEGVWH